MVSKVRSTGDLWEHEVVDYSANMVSLRPVRRHGRQHRILIGTEEWIANSLQIGGALWGVYVLLRQPQPWESLIMTPGPLETIGVGALLWLHAKWRNSVKLR
ncbi:MAG TPA: hypothetical protein VEG30_09095 [Terriglobales bacterium]|nr:hypothetical protein [Terriglobales bacterium]